MPEGRDTAKLSFMFNKISVPKMSMVYWLKVPEFVDAIFNLYDNGKTIDDKVVYDVMTSIYDEVLPYKGTERTVEYNFSKMRQGIARLREKLNIQ